MKDLAGKVAFITGGASGIGLGLARALAAEGMKIALADIDEGRVLQAANALRTGGADVSGITLDVADPAAWDVACADVEARLGTVQVVCNNAGVGPGANAVTDLPREHWFWAIGVNLNGVFLGSQIFARRMREQGLPGHIVNTASILGLFPTSRQPAYLASKYGIVGLSEGMRIDLAPFSIGVSVLCPGLVDTPLRANSQALRPAGGLRREEGALSERPRGMDANAIGRVVVESIRLNRFYIVPHPEYRAVVEQRMRRLLESFRKPAEAGYHEDPDFLGRESRKLFAQEI